MYSDARTAGIVNVEQRAVLYLWPWRRASEKLAAMEFPP